MKKNTTYTLTIISALGVALLSSCHDNKSTGYEFMPDMYRNDAVVAYAPSTIFKDSVSALAPVSGSVARGQYVGFNYPESNEGYEAAGLELKNPLPATEENLTHGKVQYMTYCGHCHGEKGDGQGWLSIKGEKFPVITYFDDAHKDLSDGKMFYSITYGKNLMGPHASQVTAIDRWKIILYINKLQDEALAATAPAPAADSTVTATTK